MASGDAWVPWIVGKCCACKCFPERWLLTFIKISMVFINQKGLRTAVLFHIPPTGSPVKNVRLREQKMTLPRPCAEPCGSPRMKGKGTEDRDYRYSLETLSHLPQLSAPLQVVSPNAHLSCQCPPLFLQPQQYIMRNSVRPGWLPELMSRLHDSQWPLGTVELTQIVCVFLYEQHYL